MVVPRGGGHGRGRGRGRGKAEPKAKAKAKAAKSKASPKKPARASEGRALVKVKKEPGTAEAAASSVDTKGKLSNLVTQGKAAANKLAKVVAGEQTVRGVRLPPRGATDKRMEIWPAGKAIAPDEPGPPERRSSRRSRQALPARLEELSAVFALASLVFFSWGGVGGVD